MKRVLIIAVPGFNRGDDAIGAVVARKFFDNKTSVAITKLSSEDVSLFGSDEIAIRKFSFWFWIKISRFMLEARVVLFGGGTLIQDAMGVSLARGLLPSMLQFRMLAALLGKPVATVPVGVDELNSSLGRGMAKLFFWGMKLVLFRDERSRYRGLRYAGGRSSALSLVYADPAFLTTSTLRGGSYRRYYVISLVLEKLERRKVEALLDELVANLSFRAPDLEVVFLVMEVRSHDELCVYQDYIKTRRMKCRLVVPRDSNEATDIVRNAEGMCAMRLHALILGYGYTPMSCVVRSEKTETFCSDLAIKNFRFNDLFSKEGNVSSEAVASLVSSSLECAQLDHSRELLPKLMSSVEESSTLLRSLVECYSASKVV